ncbi:MAG: alpha/beta hydrolase [Lachnospiraceae bacterium]|jgi:acetyl esterase/lipase|nr:alpha/beta hydrolase [Lachnospiraceae bacterium]
MEHMLNIQVKQEVLSLVSGISFSCVPAWYDSTMRDLKMDLIIPKHREGHAPCPAIVWVCGGAYRVVDRSVWVPEMLYFAQRGYVFASIEYRTSNEAEFPAALIDGKAAVRYLKAHAKELCIDPERICIMGESAGGTMASLVGVTGDRKEFDQGDNLHVDSTVRAVVDFYGITDLVHMPLNEGPGVPPWVMQDFLGQNYTEETAARASAVTYVDKHTPPFMILHGEADPLVPLEQSRQFYETLKKHGVETELYIIKGAGHGADEFYQDEVLKLVADFLERVM